MAWLIFDVRQKMDAIETRQRLLKWELLRLPFNAVCGLGAWLTWGVVGDVTVAIDELPAPSLSYPGVMRDFILGFAILNVAYCLIYAVEFVSVLIPARLTRALKSGAYVLGCCLDFTSRRKEA